MTDRFWSSEEYDERAHSLYNEGDFDGALETLKEGLALYPNAVELYVGLGYARLAREEFAWARGAFHRALVLDPAHEDAMVGLGEVFLRLGRTHEALRLFRNVEAMGFEDDLELMLTMGRALYREGLFARALDVFTRLAASRPDSADAIASVGYALHRMGDEVGAARHLRRALKMAPDLYEARIYLGHLLYDRGDWEGALRELERVPPNEHWDALAVWRLVELKRSVQAWPAGDSRLRPWQRRLDELEAAEHDPVAHLLAEVEARFGQGSSWPLRDENQLELFQKGEGGGDHQNTRVQVRTADGRAYRGSWHEVIRQLRDDAGFFHESLAQFMRRLAEQWHEQYGVDVPLTDPESFLRGAHAAGIFRLTREPGPESTPDHDT
jgi:Flp pilus assembly protein TadD